MYYTHSHNNVSNQTFFFGVHDPFTLLELFYWFKYLACSLRVT